MKKLLIITITLILALSLCACNKSSEPAINDVEPVAQNDDVIVINVSEQGQAIIDKFIAANYADSFLEENFEDTRAAILASGPQTFPDVETNASLTKDSIDGYDYYVFNGENYDNVIYYIHGGAWVYGVTNSHVSLADKLIEKLNSKVVMPLYPLGYDHTYEDTYEMIVDLYDKILSEDSDKQIFLMGDSAGGNISLGLLHLIKESDREMPDKVVLLHPAADMTMSNPDMLEIEDSDPMLKIYGCAECAKMWGGDGDLTDPLFSAVNADVSGYPSTMLFVGTRDILMPDGVILYNNMKEAGVDVTLVRGEGLYHVYEVSEIPEADEAVNLIIDFCKK